MPFIVQRYSNSTTSYSGSQYQSFTGGTSKLKFHTGTTTSTYPLTTNTSASQYCKFKIKAGTKTAFLAKSFSSSTKTINKINSNYQTTLYSTAYSSFLTQSSKNINKPIRVGRGIDYTTSSSVPLNNLGTYIYNQVLTNTQIIFPSLDINSQVSADLDFNTYKRYGLTNTTKRYNITYVYPGYTDTNTASFSIKINVQNSTNTSFLTTRVYTNIASSTRLDRDFTLLLPIYTMLISQTITTNKFGTFYLNSTNSTQTVSKTTQILSVSQMFIGRNAVGGYFLTWDTTTRFDYNMYGGCILYETTVNNKTTYLNGFGSIIESLTATLYTTSTSSTSSHNINI